MALSLASVQVDDPAALPGSDPAGARFSRPDTRFPISNRTWRLRTAVLVSLLVHALLLSLSLGGDGSGLPGLRFPWEERRLAATDLQVVLAPAQPAPVARETAPAMPRPAPVPAEQDAIPAPPTVPLTPLPPAMPPAAPAAAQVLAPRPAPIQAPPPEPVIAIDKKADQQASANLPAMPAAVVAPAAPAEDPESARQAERLALARQEAARQEQLQRDSARAAQVAQEQAMRRDAEAREQVRQENLRQESMRQEQARLAELARQEAAREELGRAEAAQQEQARLAELARQEAARQELARAETARQDAVRQEAARQAAARQEVARQEQARQEQARQEQAQRELAQREQAQRELAQREQAQREQAQQAQAQREQAQEAQAQQERLAQEAKREERLRAIGRQLDQEAAQRDAANRPSSTLPTSIGNQRRGWLFGRADPNKDLILYAEAMARKIELNPTTMDMVREVVKQQHVRPAVTVAVRADGSVEKVTFAVSSNVPAIDEAIRKVIASQAPYGPFPPALARQYDVVEIRRTWIFDVAIRLE